MLEQFYSAVGVGFCIALIMVIAKDFFHSKAAMTFLVMIFGALSFLLHNWVPSSYHPYSYMLQSATPAFFWFSCRLIFQDGEPFPKWGLFIAFYSFLIPIPKFILERQLGYVPDWLHLSGRELPQLFEYSLIIMGLIEIVKSWGGDLVESRRRLRWAIMGAAGISLGWSVFSFNLHFGSHASRLLAVDLSLLIVMGYLFKSRTEIWSTDSNYLGLVCDNEAPEYERASCRGGQQPIPSTMSVENSVRTPSAEVNSDSEELRVIQDCMQVGFYRRENLTLKDLADEVSLPEYRVRAVINKELGYRNFNEFINEFRIDEAATRLRTEPETPISNIALDVGYRTLSSFNRAFRKQKDTTPTAYRENS